MTVLDTIAQVLVIGVFIATSYGLWKALGRDE